MELWSKCIGRLEGELSPQDFNTWIRPLQVVEEPEQLRLLAPNRFVLDWVRIHHMPQISALVDEFGGNTVPRILLDIGTRSVAADHTPPSSRRQPTSAPGNGNLNPNFTFESFVEGKSNQIARAASMQVAENPGGAYNPLFIYGASGLGKTHLMHAVGNAIRAKRPAAQVLYLHSERWVGDMVRALQHNTMPEFKQRYRSVDALLIDDIQFFAGKERSQEEFFHTFNALLESRQQVVMTCDRYPADVQGLEERLKSRFGWGLTVLVEPPDLETRVAILKAKASELGEILPDEVAFFMGKRIHSHVRALEGALRRVAANAKFTGNAINLDLAKDALRDLLAAHDKQVTLDNIKKTVAEYFKIRVTELDSKKRSRSIARPRQMAMALAKELTNHSLPEIGESFGGRDHTTVLHACRKIAELKGSDTRLAEDYSNLLRTVSS